MIIMSWSTRPMLLLLMSVSEPSPTNGGGGRNGGKNSIEL